MGARLIDLVTVYATFASAEEAQRIGRSVVEERLAACVNILGAATSIYRWNGALESATECAALFKTSGQDAERLVARIADLHSYEVPAIVMWPIGHAHGPYAAWLRDQLH